MALIGACNHPVPAPQIALIPSSQPSSMSVNYTLIDRGQEVPEDGFFLSIRGARNELEDRERQELAYKLQLDELSQQKAQSDAERDAATSQQRKSDWCLRWCIEIGLALGIIGGGLAGGFIGKSLAPSH
jgi:hypothetical protein